MLLAHTALCSSTPPCANCARESSTFLAVPSAPRHPAPPPLPNQLLRADLAPFRRRTPILSMNTSASCISRRRQSPHDLDRLKSCHANHKKPCDRYNSQSIVRRTWVPLGARAGWRRRTGHNDLSEFALPKSPPTSVQWLFSAQWTFGKKLSRESGYTG
jgi:hypothetical protein